MPSRNRAVFLDRDGVLNRPRVIDGKPVAPWRMEEFEFLPGVEAALGRLKGAGLHLVVATNQPDVAKGMVARSTVEAMHARLLDYLPIDRIEVCFHQAEDGCDCRKPLPGMLLRAAERLGIDLAASFMVGDRWSDVEAGQTVGCFSIFIDRGYAERTPAHPDAVVSSLGEAAEVILQRL